MPGHTPQRNRSNSSVMSNTAATASGRCPGCADHHHSCTVLARIKVCPRTRPQQPNKFESCPRASVVPTSARTSRRRALTTRAVCTIPAPRPTRVHPSRHPNERANPDPARLNMFCGTHWLTQRGTWSALRTHDSSSRRHQRVAQRNPGASTSSSAPRSEFPEPLEHPGGRGSWCAAGSSEAQGLDTSAGFNRRLHR
jgi:hypothetical protein